MLHKLLIGGFGIYIAYLSMSYLSEKLFSTSFPNVDPTQPPAQFKYPALMVWLGCLLCSLAGYVISIVKKEAPNQIVTRERWIMGTLYATNMLSTNYSLLYIPYPVQVIGRNIRFLFVVIVGAYFSRVKKAHAHLRLGKHKIFIALLITAGVLLFNFAKGGKDKASKHNVDLQWLGYLMLGISVIVDALFSDTQAYNKSVSKPTANQLFTTTNFFGFIICLLFTVVEGSFRDSITFMINYPQALITILGIGVLQVLGQISIYYIVSNFKQHIFPLISTTRKILTVIISIFVFKHDINNYQWLAIIIVFIGMFYQFYQELKHQKQKDDRKGYEALDSDRSDRTSPQKQA